MTQRLRFRPVTPARWPDLERLFGERGAYSGCWCMFWRLRRKEFSEGGNRGNRHAMKSIVESGRTPGILAYDGGAPVGWCSVAPRETYEALERSRTLSRLDDQPVWSVVCFFVAAPYRRQGLMSELLEAATYQAAKRGATIVEGYPIDPKGRRVSGGDEAYVGIRSAFLAAGFEEVGRAGRHHIMRRIVRKPVSEAEVLRRLERVADRSRLPGMARVGIATGRAVGVSIPHLRSLARELRPDHELALRLWATAVHEARILATMVADPLHVSDGQMEAWVADLDSWDVCDQACGNLWEKTALAYQKALQWSARDEEFVKRAGFSLMACLAVSDKGAKDRELERFLPVIRREAVDERNYVKKAVSWALRQIGKRSPALNRKAVEAASRIRGLDSKSARWIASDALRELTSAAVKERLR